jgi:hypothetical protein
MKWNKIEYKILQEVAETTYITCEVGEKGGHRLKGN